MLSNDEIWYTYFDGGVIKQNNVVMNQDPWESEVLSLASTFSDLDTDLMGLFCIEDLSELHESLFLPIGNDGQHTNSPASSSSTINPLATSLGSSSSNRQPLTKIIFDMSGLTTTKLLTRSTRDNDQTSELCKQVDKLVITKDALQQGCHRMETRGRKRKPLIFPPKPYKPRKVTVAKKYWKRKAKALELLPAIKENKIGSPFTSSLRLPSQSCEC